MTSDPGRPTVEDMHGAWRAWRWLALFAFAYGTLHHQGFLLGRLGEVGATGTRWADWVDIATPYLVVFPAAMALREVSATGRQWIVFAVGAISYIEGHGIHLSANSIGNVGEVSDGSAGDVIHLWDELVGHYLWYGGFSLICAVCCLAFVAASIPPLSGYRVAAAVCLSVLVGFTYATNSLEGHFAVPASLFSTAMLIWASWRLFQPNNVGSGRLVLLVTLSTFASALLPVGFYGLWHRGFPDPTSVGWNVLAR